MTRGKTRPVVVVGESGGLRDALVDTLSQVEGIQVDALEPQADNAATVREIEAFHADLVFLDVFVPTQGGARDLMTRLFAARPGTTLVALSTIADESAAQTARGLGAWDALIMPHETPRAASLARLWLKLGASAR